MDLDHDACYRAISQRDARFDGRLFTGVKTTGIYCRPICPARTPLSENVTFYPDRRGRTGGRVPPVPALPTGNRAGSGRLARHLEHGVARAGADRARRSG